MPRPLTRWEDALEEPLPPSADGELVSLMACEDADYEAAMVALKQVGAVLDLDPSTEVQSAQDADAAYSEALAVFLKLAARGHVPSQEMAGFMLTFGIGPRHDPGEGERWLIQASHGGDGGASHNLGTLYLIGSLGAPADRQRAKAFYKLARRQGVCLFRQPPGGAGEDAELHLADDDLSAPHGD
jgi:TPR repeat protein